MKERYFLEHIIVPIAVFVVTTASPPEKLSWSARRIFPNIWWEMFSESGTSLRGGGTALNNQTQDFRLLEICLGRSKRVV